MDFFADKLYMVSVMALPFLLAVTWREALRGYVAHKMGDDTPETYGRLSANPLNHADPIWTGVVPVVAFVLLNFPILFGHAKPVPINPNRFHDGRKGMLYLSLAGPIALAFMIFIWCYLVRVGLMLGFNGADWFIQSAYVGAQLASFFFVIGLLPIPGLDGGKILEHFLPYEAALSFSSIEPYAFFIVIGIFILLPDVIRIPAIAVYQLFAMIVGV